MDILSPDLLTIDGICYRINNSQNLSRRDDYNNEIEENFELHEEDMDVDDEDVEVVTCDNGRLKTSLHVPQCFFGHVIGTKGTTKKRIETETRTDIKIPSRGQSGSIYISGSNIKGVSKAVKRVKMIVNAARQKQTPTHFLSIPINSEVILQNYLKFSDDILKNNMGSGIHPSIFIKPAKLHITLLVMHLADDEERLMAKDILYKSHIIESHFKDVENRIIKISGVNYMNDDPKLTHILYANVQDLECGLSDLTKKLTEAFSKSGFLIRNRDEVKLHITLMNSKDRDEDHTDDIKLEDDKFHKKLRKPFDSSLILKEYKNIDFGEQMITNVHLSQMKTEAPNGYYQHTAIIPF